ncbi:MULTISPECIES: hypothetical protein [Saccharothrix]|uniref:hypothetical protein n=1 Tax=Saccharothrix TaxID=2071 RepID=UPI00116116B7|nr:hypothetical protein [Saccharothrix sp. CB00851]
MRSTVRSKLAVSILGATLVLGVVAVPATAAAPDQQTVPNAQVAWGADIEPPDVAAGHARPAPPVKLGNSGTVAQDNCSLEALETLAASAKPLGAEAGEYAGLAGFSCLTSANPKSGAAAEARDAALGKFRAEAASSPAARADRLAEARSGDVGTQAYIQPPDWCFDHAFDGWWGTRLQACMINSWHVDQWVRNSAGTITVVGQYEWLEISYAYTSGSIDSWGHQLRTQKYYGVGHGNTAATITGYSWCDGECKQDVDTGLRPTSFATGTNNDGEAANDSTRGEPGGIGYSAGNWEYWIQYTVFPQVLPPAITPPGVRCDNALGDNQNNSGDPFAATAEAVIGAGCVFYGFLPVMTYSKTGSYPTLAAHIEAAQISGLPGAYPAGAVLNRITNPTLKNQNGYKACPPSSVWPRPTGKSCDEYPFRSTSQGASTQTPQGTARTFAPPTVSWCEMNPAWGVPTGVTGPTGWSSCMINATHNGNGGAALGAFYSSNRVLDGDPFKVWIQP